MPLCEELLNLCLAKFRSLRCGCANIVGADVVGEDRVNVLPLVGVGEVFDNVASGLLGLVTGGTRHHAMELRCAGDVSERVGVTHLTSLLS